MAAIRLTDDEGNFHPQITIEEGDYRAFLTEGRRAVKSFLAELLIRAPIDITIKRPEDPAEEQEP